MVRQRSRSLLPPPHAGRMPTRQNAAPEPSWTFVLSGGVVCLDFANTLSWRWSGQPIERLTSYGRLVSWAKQDGIVTGGEAARLRRVAARQPARAQLVLTRGVALREAVFHIFSAVVARRAVPGRAMALLNYILARALTQQPLLLLLDEPTLHLDIAAQVDLLRRLRRLAAASMYAVVVVTHELNLAAEFADRIVLLDRGKTLRVGTPVEVYQQDLLQQVFGTLLHVDLNRRGVPKVVFSGKEA